MRLSLIVAKAENQVIGRDNQMPWRLKGELAFFKKVTEYHALIMGRKTFESLGKKPLKNRYNIILSRQKPDSDLGQDGCFCDNLDDAIALAKQWTIENSVSDHEFFIIGGGHIYAQSFDRANRLYVTHVEKNIDGDCYFPMINDNDWRVREEFIGSRAIPDYPNDQPHYHTQILDRVS